MEIGDGLSNAIKAFLSDSDLESYGIYVHQFQDKTLLNWILALMFVIVMVQLNYA